jgi:dynein heavy chain
LGIDEFIVECLNEIKMLKDKANSVFKSEDKIRNILKQIGNSNLVKELDLKKSDNKELTDFFAYYDDHKDKIKGDLLNKYEDITGIICEIEKSTFEPSNRDETGLQLVNKNPKKYVENLGENVAMGGYYRFWEISILNNLTKSILKAIITLYELFSMPRQEDNQNILFTIKSKFISSKEIMYNPNTLDIDQMLKKLIGNFQNSGNDFLRWINNTCKSPDVTELIEERLEAIAGIYSYGAEINTNEDIKFYIQKLYSIVQKIDENLNNNKAKYTREYQRDYFGNWGSSRSKMEIHLERNKSLKNFEIKLNDIIEYLEDFKKKFSKRRICDGNCEINNEELINKGIEQIQKIMNDMLKILAKQVEEEDIKKLMDSIENSKEKLREKIVDSDTLKKVLDYISKISNKKLSMELKIKDIEEKLRFLELHNYPCLSDIFAKFELMKKEWSNLRVKAIKKDEKLLTKKRNLAEETKKDVEILKENVKVIYKQYKESGPTTEKIDLMQGYHLLKEYNEKLQILKDKRNNIVECQRLFNLSITTFFEINEMSDLNSKIEPIYLFYKEFTDFYDEQLFKPWGKIEVNILEKEDEVFQEKMKEFKRMQLGQLSPFKKLDEIKDKYHEILNDVIKPLKFPIITERNLKELMKELRKSIPINFQTTTLKEILAQDLLKDKEKIFNLVNDASKENDIKVKLQEIEKVLETLNFQIKPYKRGNEDKGFIFKDVSEEQALLQENITNLQQFSNNKHAGAFKPQIVELEQEMNLIMEIIEVWIEVQKKWMYLESIFVGSEDIRQKLPDEAKEFDEYDKKFKLLMIAAQKKPSIRFQCKEKDRKFELKNKILVKFEQAEKKLTEHLDSKKNEFSRFYFLTEQDLLQILGSSDPLNTLNPHMIKLYENCKELLSEKKNIIGMKSTEDEFLPFEKPIRLESQQQVGLWMNKVDDEMKSSLKEYTREAIQDFTKEELFKFIKSKIGMVIINSIECWWTFSLEDVFRRVKEGDKYAMKKELERQTNFVLALVKTVRKPELQIRDRQKLNNIIIRVVHGREIVDKFVRDSILDVREFEWESQLKFYWDKRKDDMVIRQCNGVFFSCYEYQGLQGRLVVTPLTDRCVMTLTTALTFYLGGAPAGPAGTGKTETVKDLGKGLGIRVVVQNCSNTLDYIFMGQFFSGLSQTGFWGCFDEFNRINREVLSVITTQIKSIQTALMQKKESWILLAKEVKLLPTIGIYITMNPNYEGRSELPDNLKALFRPVTMVTPDQLLICENMLLSEGFHDSKRLACKIDKLYLLSKEQLSKQHHYEWGLRSIKSVLSAAGLLKRRNPEMPEDMILMKAMRDINMPKFLSDDALLFEGLVKDLFPTLEHNSNEGDELKNLIINVTKSLNYEVIEGQLNKVQQMYEVMQIRHCTLICGPPQSGKSCILDILKKTFEQLRSTVVTTYIINPKAQTIPRLYGIKNDLSGDFEIGILANIFAIANQPLTPGKNELRWVLLDGDIDPIWIENMNSVMDDSKCLTLENKDRILMQKYCSLLLESSNIQSASLATISRLGMIYVDGGILKLEAVFYRWLSFKNPADWEDATRDNLRDLFKRYVLQIIKYIEKGVKGNLDDGPPLKTIIKRYGASMINQLCTLLDSMLPPTNPPTEISQLEPIFAFCMTWSLGSCLQSQEREKFSKYVRELSAGGSSLPNNLFDKMFDHNTGKFEDWDLVKNIIDDPVINDMKFNEIIIPTLDTKRYSYMIKQLLSIKMPTLFVGESGTGKTITIQNYLKHATSGNNKSNYLILNINFSSRTTALDFQLNLEEILEMRLMRTMGPPSGKELIVFIDDLGMPTVDKYETQQPLAFMKFLIEKKNYYTRDNKDLIRLVDTNVN